MVKPTKTLQRWVAPLTYERPRQGNLCSGKKRDVPVIALRFLLRPKAKAVGRATPKGIAFIPA